jgi:hypothetical protein
MEQLSILLEQQLLAKHLGIYWEQFVEVERWDKSTIQEEFQEVWQKDWQVPHWPPDPERLAQLHKQKSPQ